MSEFLQGYTVGTCMDCGYFYVPPIPLDGDEDSYWVWIPKLDIEESEEPPKPDWHKEGF